MSYSRSNVSVEFCSSYGQHLLDHLAADGAGLTAGQVTVVAVLQVYANFLGSLHLEAVHSLTGLGNIDLVVILVAHNVSLLLVDFPESKTLSCGKRLFSFRNPSLTKVEFSMNGEWRKGW